MAIARVRILVCSKAASAPSFGTGAELALGSLVHEFPTVEIGVECVDEETDTPMATIDLATWDDRKVDFPTFDGHIDDLSRRGPVTLVLRGGLGEAVRAACEMLTRFQRLVVRRNASSTSPEFDALLTRLGAIHDRSKPLAVADWNHVVDTWQWMLRLDPCASREPQMAALMHDVERLESEVDARVEHLAPNYSQFKETHARRGAEMALTLLEQCGIDRTTRVRVAELIAGHECPGDDPDRLLLNDADALSFFSQNSSGYLDYFGTEQTQRKIAWSLGRMRVSATARLETIRLRVDVARLLDRARNPRPPARVPPGREVRP
jgi:hypothetical protein